MLVKSLNDNRSKMNYEEAITATKLIEYIDQQCACFLFPMRTDILFYSHLIFIPFVFISMAFWQEQSVTL